MDINDSTENMNKKLLDECCEKFSTQDFFMEPNVSQTLSKYFNAGGDRELAANLLSTHYTAIAHMSNLLAELLLTTGLDLSDIQAAVENNLKQLLVKYFDPKMVDVYFFGDNVRDLPPWLETLIRYPQWRRLIYKLSEDYPDCVMLTFTIKLISDAGHQSEITSISTASQQLEVFSRILKNSINTFLEIGDEKLNSNMMEFVKLVCHGEHTYLYSQALLHLLSLEMKNGSNTKRLSQEIAKFAQENGHDATSMTISLLGASSQPKVSGALSAMLSKNALNPADINLLYRSYQAPDAPPVEFLRVPQFLDLLLEALFKPGSKIHSEHKFKYVYLLAYASSVFETYKKPFNYSSYNNVSMRKSIDRKELASTIEAIEKMSNISSESKGSSEIIPELSTIFQLIREYQVVAYGVVSWVKHIVSEPSYFKLNTEQTPLHLVLLDEVSSCHTTLHSKVLELFIEIIGTSYDDLEVLARLELQKMLLDRLIHLLSKGCVVPVLNYIKSCSQKDDMDISLIRYFVTEILSMIKPPYSDKFVELFLPLVKSDVITGDIKNEAESSLVTDFIEHCQSQSKVSS